LFARYTKLIRGVSVNWIGKLGVVLTTSSFITLVVLELARILGIVTGSYTGLVTYMLFPSLFVVGLILIPLGWLRYKHRRRESADALLGERFKSEDVSGGFFGSGLFRTIGLLTLLNVVFMVVISLRMFTFMDGPEFCGTACHSVMNPEWVTYQQSPHARVRCVDCHVGEGAEALINSKLNGLWQIASVTFDLLERPIPTPVRQLRPARETCEKCHWPDKFYGNSLKTHRSFGPDESSTPSYTTLSLKVDAGRGGAKAGIHWHISDRHEVRYSSVNDERVRIVWTEVEYPDGGIHRYEDNELTEAAAGDSRIRVMDCVDCHNRATHIYENRERAIDERINLGLMDRTLPFLKREAVRALSSDYPSREAGLEAIANHMYGFYRRSFPDIARSRAASIDSAVEALQAVFRRNIHPEMNITWGTYPSHIGHTGEQGCFRCHNSRLTDGNGNSIGLDCTLCHSILADGHDEPFKFLQQADSTDPDYERHRYLRDEFMEQFSE
jgi:hypothetical protein